MSEPSNALSDYIQGWKQRRLKKSKSDGQGRSFPSRELIDTADLKEGNCSFFKVGFANRNDISSS